jgi:hypothetical protein
VPEELVSRLFQRIHEEFWEKKKEYKKLKIVAYGIKYKNCRKRSCRRDGSVLLVISHRRKHQAVDTGYCNATDIRTQQKNLNFPSTRNT